MLYSPSLHGMRNGQPSSAIGSVNALDYETVLLDASSNAPRKMFLMEGREAQFMLFNFSSASDSTTAPVASITIPRFQIVWPYRWSFKGGFASCLSGNTASPGVNFGVYRNGVNVFTNSPAVSSLNALIVSGTALLGRSNYVAAHTSHQVWNVGDRVEFYCTAGANNWRGGAIMIEGSRFGGVL